MSAIVQHSLLCRIGTRLCALPLAHVLETLRPLKVAPLTGAPDHVLGVALIRGVAQPVIDVARVLGERDAPVLRYVTLQVGERRVALAVGAVLGTRTLNRDELQELPPLLRHAGHGTLTALGKIDAELLLVLDSAKLLPEDEILEAVDAVAQAGTPEPEAPEVPSEAQA